MSDRSPQAERLRDNSLYKLYNLLDEAQRSNAWQVLGFGHEAAFRVPGGLPAGRGCVRGVVVMRVDPDCIAGKHLVCLGETFDDLGDVFVPCGCECHEEAA